MKSKLPSILTLSWISSLWQHIFCIPPMKLCQIILLVFYWQYLKFNSTLLSMDLFQQFQFTSKTCICKNNYELSCMKTFLWSLSDTKYLFWLLNIEKLTLFKTSISQYLLWKMDIYALCASKMWFLSWTF